MAWPAPRSAEPGTDHSRARQQPLPVWVAISGTPASAVRAGALGLPMMMDFFTAPEQFVPRVELYYRAAEKAGHDPAGLRLGASGHMFLGRTSQGARDSLYPYHAKYLRQMGMTGSGAFPRQTPASRCVHCTVQRRDHCPATTPPSLDHPPLREATSPTPVTYWRNR